MNIVERGKDRASQQAAKSGPAPRPATTTPREIHVELDARETAWEIAPGLTVSAWGYHGMVPGPTIVAQVGDTIVAHLVSNLPEPTVIHWHGLRLGELQVWEIVNETGMDHPFHLHGFFFQVVAIDGERTTPISWEDTVNVAAKRRVTLAFRPDDRPGQWMYHCHILEHHAAGMMGHFEVVR